MPYFAEADIATMLADSPNVISATNGETPVIGPCLFNESDEVILEGRDAGGNIAHMCRAYVETTKFAFLVGNSECTVDGRNFTVWKRLQEGDGAITQLLLREA
jgi:hypothetical protein